MKRLYKGTLVGPVKSNYGFIGLSTTTRVDGSPMDIDTSADIYLHKDDCDTPLCAGLEVEFCLGPDQKRTGAFRAFYARESETSSLAHLAAGGIKLSVRSGSGKSNVLESPLVLVSWTISPELAKWVRDRKLSDDAVKLVVVQWPLAADKKRDGHVSESETRHILDLTERMASITLTRPGTFRLVALLMGYGGTDGDLHEAVISTNFSGYRVDIMKNTGSSIGLEEINGGVEWQGSGYMDVEIPANLFAERPKDWEWVNGSFREKTGDSCSTNMRRLYAYTVQPLLVFIFSAIIWAAMILSVLIHWSIGVVNLDYSVLTKPWRYSPRRVKKWKSTSLLVPRYNERRIILPMVVSPAALACFALLTLLFSQVANAIWSWSIFGIIFTVGFFVFMVFTLVIWVIDAPESAEEEEQEEELAKQLRSRQIEQELLMISDGGQAPGVRNLPLRPNTIRFHYAKLKQNFCKFYADVD